MFKLPKLPTKESNLSITDDKLKALKQLSDTKIGGFFNINRSILVVIIAAVVGWMLMTIGALSSNYKWQRLVDNAKLQNQVAEIENENLRLEQQYYRTPEYTELSAKSLLGKSLPGEHLVVLPRANYPTNSDDASSSFTAKSNFDQWMEFLFGEHKK